MRKKLKVVGQRGSWFASIGNDSYPCVHEYWWRSPARYCDPGAGDGNPKWKEFVDALKTKKRAILTKDLVENGTFRGRLGYIALWEIDNVRLTDGVLEFEFTKRIDELE